MSNQYTTTTDLTQLDQIAYNLGYNLENYDKWYNNLPYHIRNHSKMHIIKQSYYRGAYSRMDDEPDVIRLCVYISGETNTGKKYSVKQALKNKQTCHTVGNTSDALMPYHNAIQIANDVCPDLPSLSSDSKCFVHRRHNCNSVWTGNHLIITGLDSFDTWLKSCNVTKLNKDVIASRFFICEMQTDENDMNHIVLKKSANYGTPEQIQEKQQMFFEFQAKVNQTCSKYRPRKTDYPIKNTCKF